MTELGITRFQTFWSKTILIPVWVPRSNIRENLRPQGKSDHPLS